jgi:hypothetical protein
MKKVILASFVLFSIFTTTSCTKSSDGPDVENPVSVDYSGTYTGTTTANVTAPGVNSSMPYEMVIKVSKGDKPGEIKLLFGAWLTPATVAGTKFTIQQTSFSGPTVTTGSGSFSGNKMTITYIQKISNQTNKYTGTLTKM